MKNIFAFTVLLLLKTGFTYSQAPVYLFPSDSLRIFSGGHMSVWGNFYNTGNIASGGSLVISNGGNLYFYGDTFINSNASKIEGNGNLEFRRPRPSPYASSSGQTIRSGGSAVSFPVITLNTTSTLSLNSNDLKIRDSLKFTSGHILLNKNDLILGNGNPGVITGYNENRFVITNGNTIDTLKGYLIREGIAGTSMIFPVGQAIGDYTPASIGNSGTQDNFKVRVFDTAYENGYTLLTNINPSANNRSVQRTWDIREGNTGGSNVTLSLQHNTSTESSLFNSSRNKAFISHFVGTYPNNGGDTVSNWQWDMFKLASTSSPTSPGTLTSGSSIAGAAMKTRSGISSFSPFSITIWGSGAIPLPLHILNFEASWANKENAILKWKLTDPENLGFVSLERSEDGVQFLPVRTFDLKTGAVSFNLMDIGIGKTMGARVYYRLKLTDKVGAVSMSQILSLTKNSDENAAQVTINPNPGNEIFYIKSGINSSDILFSIQLINSFGQLVYSKKSDTSPIAFQGSIDISGIPSGIYELKIESINGTNIQKVIISH